VRVVQALFTMSLRLIVENLIKYGWRLHMPSTEFIVWAKTWPALSCLVAVSVAGPVVSFQIEAAAFAGAVRARTAAYLHTAWILTVFVVPMLVIHFSDSSLRTDPSSTARNRSGDSASDFLSPLCATLC
jgi:hypothetical protein